MRTSLFIKTCVADYCWLEWCLKSIDKYASFDEYVVAIGISDFHTIPKRLKREPFKWIKVEDDLDRGYLNQQHIKLHADLFTSGDYIVYMDSDCVFSHNVSIETYLDEDRPIIPYTPYATLGDAVPWKAIVEKSLGFTVENEFMRRHPFVYLSSTVRNFRDWFEIERGKRIGDYIKAQPGKEFSEYNSLGSWTFRYEHSNYKFMNTETEDIPPSPIRQFWSYAGISGEIGEELAKICN